MTTNNTVDATELDRLREHNKQLLAELKAERATSKSAQDALQAAKTSEAAMCDRWYALEVLAPLEADLRGAAAGPWKYLKDTCVELGLLKMQPDDHGVERPAWFDEKGEPANLSQGLGRFLADVYDRTGNDLGHCIKGSGASGGGASSSSGWTAAPEIQATEPVTTARPALGLR